MDIGTELLKLFGKGGEHWCQGAYARNKIGNEVKPDSPQAVKWCLYGAVDKLNLGPVINSGLNKFLSDSNQGVAKFNDLNPWKRIRQFLLFLQKEEKT